jgi:hypothetical protein
MVCRLLGTSRTLVRAAPCRKALTFLVNLVFSSGSTFCRTLALTILKELTIQQNKGLGIPTKAGRYLFLGGILNQPPLRAGLSVFKEATLCGLLEIKGNYVSITL